MARIPYTGTIVILWLVLVTSLASAHMIEVMASKKECFFEDLHKHDKVCGEEYAVASAKLLF